jgi:hypothetical protein
VLGLQQGGRKAKEQKREETSRTFCWTAFKNPSKERFSMRDTSHVFANEPPLAGLVMSCCKLNSNTQNVYGPGEDLRTRDLRVGTGQEERRPSEN